MKLRLAVCVLILAMVIGQMVVLASNEVPLPRYDGPAALATPITVQTIAKTGTTPTFNAASSDGNTFVNNGHTYVEIKNGSGSIITATFVTPYTFEGNALADLAVPIPANTGDKTIGPFLPEAYNDSSGKTTITWSDTTTVTFSVLSLQ